MAVPYHTHNFEIPTATKQDMVARASNEKVVTPSVLGTAATADTSEFATAEQGKKADSAIQAENLGTLARKNKVNLAEIETNGIPSSTTFLSGNGWQTLSGGGDMTIAIYDPSHKKADTFDMGNMKEAANAKIMSADERKKIANLDNAFLSRSGGSLNGNLTINGSLNCTKSIQTNGWFNTKGTGSYDIGIHFDFSGDGECYSDFVFTGKSLNIYLNKFGDVAEFYDNGTTRFADSINIQDKTYWQPDGNIRGECWTRGSLYNHIEDRACKYASDLSLAAQNKCVTDARFAGYGEFAFTPGEGGKSAFNNPVPSGYVMTGLWKINSQWEVISYSQPQVYIANRGWFALGGW
ncbi:MULTISPECIES: hypothetical protein [Bartonella]|uniref:hypothetical protein n=1 Tax=Bartonella TaxID=773 RepID=UPI0018DE6487|nr:MULTISPECIES: hypothetical protein [Bartonella]MBH9976000.1 hypothetical protein [Bartonella choladocola]MBI0015659.1 hypothetical protein [Bartonella sp. B10834G3]